MSTFDQRRPEVAKTSSPPPAAGVPDLWQHAALCRLALPLRGSERSWRRETDLASARIEAGSIADPDARDGRREVRPPAGPLLRLLLAHIFSAALRGEGPVAVVGDGPEAVAVALRLPAPAPLREIQDQMQRLLASRIALSLDGGPELMVFDARSARFRDSGKWQATVRLNERFFGSLQRHAVMLDAAALAALHDQAQALDAYAWLAATLQALPAGEARSTGWEALRAGFGGSQAAVQFRRDFEEALQAATPFCRGAALRLTEEGVELRRAAPAREPAAAPPPEAAAAPPSRPAPEAPQAPARPARPARQTSAPPRQLALPVAPEPPPESAPQPLPPEAPSDLPAEPPAELPSFADLEAELEATLGGSYPDEPPPPAPSMPAPRPHDPARAPERPAAPAAEERVALMPHLTGLPHSVWLRRGRLQDILTIEVQPPGRNDQGSRAVIGLEPIVQQVSGNLHPRELERIAAWTSANTDLIEGYWTGSIRSNADALQRVRKVPASRW